MDQIIRRIGSVQRTEFTIDLPPIRLGGET
jgi:hypothetical protein